MTDFARDWEPTPVGLYAWDAPQPEESAQGLLLRLAEMHGHASTDRTAASVAVGRSRMAHGDEGQIEKFAAAIRQDPFALKADSVLRDAAGHLTLRGQDLTDFINFGVRRLCPGCVAESPHQRFWWDIRSISTCPRHGLKLVGRCDCAADAKLSWRAGGVLHCSRCGRRNLRPAAISADPMVLRTDTYLLSRLGAGKAEPVPVLDALRLKDVFLTLERVGAAAQAGYNKEWQSAASLGLSLETVQALGFRILADGGLDEVLTRIYDAFIAAGGRPEQGFSSCYGWFYQWFNHKRGLTFSPLLAEAFLHHGAARFPIVPKSGLGTLSDPKRKKLSLKEAASICGTSVSAMRNIGVALGVTRVAKKSGSQISFPADVVARVAADLGNACSLSEAKGKLGVGAKIVHQFMASGILSPALDGGKKYRHVYIFRQPEIDALLEKLANGSKLVREPTSGLSAVSQLGRGHAATIADCVRLILDGKAAVAERVSGAQGLQALYVDQRKLAEIASTPFDGKGVTLSAAIRIMRLNRRGLSRALAIGLLPGVKPGATTIPEKVVRDFAQKYIMLSEVRSHLGGWYPNVRDTMERMGFPPDPQLAKCMHAGYPRKEVEKFLADVAAGRISLKAPPTAHEILMSSTRQLLQGAKRPIRTEELLTALRKKCKIGPSDQDNFFHSVMWKERAEFVFITAAGWWLRDRPYLGRVFAVETEASVHALIEDAVIDLLRGSQRPRTKDEIVADLAKKDLEIPAADTEVYLRKLTARRRDAIAKLTGLGYWDRARPYLPALYHPRTCPTGVQTAFVRIGLLLLQHLKETRRPVERADLAGVLDGREVLRESAFTFDRGYISKAVAEFPDDIVYLRGHGYWLKDKPWPPADYRPRPKKAAA